MILNEIGNEERKKERLVSQLDGLSVAIFQSLVDAIVFLVVGLHVIEFLVGNIEMCGRWKNVETHGISHASEMKIEEEPSHGIECWLVWPIPFSNHITDSFFPC